MDPSIDIVVRLEADRHTGETLLARIRHPDPSLAGRSGRLGFAFRVDVKRSRGIDASATTRFVPITLGEGEETVIPLPKGVGELLEYRGKEIDVIPAVTLNLDDAPPRACRVELYPDQRDPGHDGHAGQLLEPTDAFNLISNLGAIPLKNRLIAVALIVIGGTVALVNALIGVRDQFVPESRTWVYDHRNSDGESESPIEKALAGSGALGLAIWLALKAQLRRYMTLKLRFVGPPRPDTRLSADELVEGSARVPLEQIRVRVVACNRECGVYETGSGTKKRKVTFRTPVRAVLLYDQYLAYVPANTPIASMLAGEVDFGPMFDCLWPPVTTETSHGLDVVWEVQLLHPKFVDHELPGSTAGLTFAHFLRG